MTEYGIGNEAKEDARGEGRGRGNLTGKASAAAGRQAAVANLGQENITKYRNISHHITKYHWPAEAQRMV